MELNYIVTKSDDSIKQILKNKFNMSERFILKLKKTNGIYINNVSVPLWFKIAENDSLKINQESTISKNVMCLFPSIIKENSTLYIQWVEYFNLYSCKSSDLGISWSRPTMDINISNQPFIRYQYISDNITSIFAPKDNLSLSSLSIK